MKTAVSTLAAAYLREFVSSAAEDFWAVDEVNARVSHGDDLADAWAVTEALIEAADEDSLGYVGAGPLEDFVRRFGARHLPMIEGRARQDAKFRACLGTIWLQSGDLPPDVLDRIVRASGGRITPLGRGGP